MGMVFEGKIDADTQAERLRVKRIEDQERREACPSYLKSSEEKRSLFDTVPTAFTLPSPSLSLIPSMSSLLLEC
jgi:hypothetical protein